MPAVFGPLATPALGLFTHRFWIPYSATPAENSLVVGYHPTDVIWGYPESLGDFRQFLRRLLQRGVPGSKSQRLAEDLDVLLKRYVQESSVAGSKPALAQMGIVWIDRLVCIDRELCNPSVLEDHLLLGLLAGRFDVSAYLSLREILDTLGRLNIANRHLA